MTIARVIWLALRQFNTVEPIRFLLYAIDRIRLPILLSLQARIAQLDELYEECDSLASRLYSMPDTDGNGKITKAEFDKWMHGYYAKLHPNIPAHQYPKFGTLDDDGNGIITFDVSYH